MNTSDDKYIPDEFSQQLGGHSLQHLQRQTSVRCASQLTNTEQSTFITTAVDKGGNSEEVFEYAQQALRVQKSKEYWDGWLALVEKNGR